MKRGIYPGSQAGEADMFAWSQDQQTWVPTTYWLWNLRGEISANMSSGNYQLNTPIFDMYINDLSNIEAWTNAQMGGLPGACVPETMRFNGNGYYNDGPGPATPRVPEPRRPNWNAQDITSGAELSLYMWEQYQAHRRPRVPEAGVPVHGGGRAVPAGLPAGRLRRHAARGRQRARDPVGGAGPDHRHRGRPDDLPDHRRRPRRWSATTPAATRCSPSSPRRWRRSRRTRGPTRRRERSC